MKSETETPRADMTKALPLLKAYGLLIVAGAALVVGYFVIDQTVHSWSAFLRCSEYAPRIVCSFVFPSHATTLMVVSAAALIAALRRELVGVVVAATRRRLSLTWSAVHLVGLGMILAAPALLYRDDAPAVFWSGALASVVGVALWVFGALFAVVPPAAWRAAATHAGVALPIAAAIAFFAKPMASALEWVWYEGSIARATFDAVAALMTSLGYTVIAEPADFILGIGDFVVTVDRQCSGIEGFVLITSFLALYGALFRDQLRLDRFALLFPIGIALSWCFNVVRIAALIAIGAHGDPELAINGFHSHAGWLAFLTLSLSLAVATHNIAWFRKAAPTSRATAVGATGPRPAETASASARPPFFEDLKAAEITPFFVFMVSALLASTFSETPGLLYPLRFAAVIAILWAFRRVLARIDWRPDLFALGVGAAIGVAWVATAPQAAEGDKALSAVLQEASAAFLVVWVVCRILGTAVMVPIVEELFFRGYILRAIDGVGAPERRILALIVSAGLFAALHDRWLAAGIAGLIFGLIALRRDRIADAVYAHAAANAVIAGWAASSGDWSVI